MTLDRKRLLRIAAVVLLAATPALSVTVVLAVVARGTLFDCIPLWNDELGYWLQISAFREAGFGGGYFTVDERPAPAAFTHFFTHGPAFPMLYGTIARMVGWQRQTSPFIHLGLLFVALCVWGMISKPSGARAAGAVFVLATYWPCVFYLPTAMQEGLHSALAVLLATAMHGLMRGQTMTWRSHAAIVVAVLACSQFRATWSLLLVPYAWLALRKSGSKRQACGIAAALALVAATVASAMFLGAPFPSFLSRTIPMAWSSPGSALGLLVNHCLENELQFLSPTSATVMETALRYEIMATCLVALGVVARPRPQAATSERDESSATAGFILLNLLPVVGVLLLFYDVGGGRDYRALAPHFLISLMLLLSGRAYRWALAVGFVNLALLVPFCEHFSAFHTHRVNCDASRIDTLQQELAGILRFDPHADPWENTVLVTIDAVQYPLLAVSPGIGLSARLQPLGAGEKVEIRSKYILMDARDFEKFLGDQPRLKFVGHTSYGDLYLNLDVGCGASEKFKVESSKPVP